VGTGAASSARVRATLDGLKEIVVIWSAELRRALRSARTVVLLGLYGLFTALMLLVVGSISRSIREGLQRQAGADAEQAQAALEQAQQGVLGFWVGNDPAMLEALSRVPMVVLVVFKMTLFFLPAYIVLMGFDQVSGEVGPRSIRYATVRARRSSVLLGKFLTQATLLLALVLVVDLGIFVYAKLTTPDFALGLMLLTLGRFWMAAVVYSLAYVALTTLCSTLFRSPGVSLVFNFILLFVFWLVDIVARALPSPADALRYASPSAYSTNLLHPQLWQFLLSAGAYAGFALLFLGAAHLILRGRDL
jgi:ABC-2 type transport system permease protein